MSDAAPGRFSFFSHTLLLNRRCQIHRSAFADEDVVLDADVAGPWSLPSIGTEARPTRLATRPLGGAARLRVWAIACGGTNELSREVLSSRPVPSPIFINQHMSRSSLRLAVWREGREQRRGQGCTVPVQPAMRLVVVQPTGP